MMSVASRIPEPRFERKFSIEMQTKSSLSNYHLAQSQDLAYDWVLADSRNENSENLAMNAFIPILYPVKYFRDEHCTMNAYLKFYPRPF